MVDLACNAQLLHLCVSNLHAQVFADVLSTGHNGNVLQEGFPPLAKAWGFDGNHIEDAS